MKQSKIVIGSILAAFSAFSFALSPATFAHDSNIKAEADAKAHANGKFTMAQVKADAKIKSEIERNFKDALNALSKRFNWRTNWEGAVNLTNTLNTGLKVSGRGHIKLTDSTLYDTSLKLRLSNFPVSTTVASAYEVWLVSDSPAASPQGSADYQLSLGAVTPSSKNTADLSFSQKMINPKTYDRLVVTQEPLNDTDPKPGTPVFSANLDSFVFDEISMKTKLLGSNEVPAVASAASGVGRFTINTKDNTLTYKVAFDGMATAQTGAHIHGSAQAGANAGVLFNLPLGSSIAGVWHYNESMEDDILQGKTYVNIHSAQYPNGEIRGQISF